jgi:hypothetical protein
MDDYYVTMRDMTNGNRMEYRYKADSFAHAEEQAKQDLPDETHAIITIDLDYHE